jgi:hypothetical protein
MQSILQPGIVLDAEWTMMATLLPATRSTGQLSTLASALLITGTLSSSYFIPRNSETTTSSSLCNKLHALILYELAILAIAHCTSQVRELAMQLIR